MYRLLQSISLMACVLIALVSFAGCSGKSTVDPGAEAGEASSSLWGTVGPGGAGAMFEATVSPHDPDVFFMRCDMTGAYSTEDGGASWRNINLRTVVKAFEFDPLEPGTIYASNSGLYVSLDLGRRWRLLYPDPSNVTQEKMVGDEAGHRFGTVDGMPGGSIERICVDPDDNSIIYIGVTTPGADSVRLMTSTDKGKTWRTLASVAGRKTLEIFSPRTIGMPGRVGLVTERSFARVDLSGGVVEYCKLPIRTIREATGGAAGRSGVIYLLTGYGRDRALEDWGVFCSSDGGESWQQRVSGLENEWAAADISPASLVSLDASSMNPEVLYLSIREFPADVDGKLEYHAGIMKSSDGGRDWQWVYRANSEVVLSDNSTEYWRDWSYGPGGWSPWSVGVSPSNQDVCYGAGTRNLGTVDGGVQWQQIVSDNLPDGSSATRGTEGTTTYGMHFDPFDDQHLFISYTDLGAYHSFNGGKSWFHSIKGIPREWINTCYWMEFDPKVEGLLWGAWSNVHDLPRAKMYRSGNLVNGRKKGGVAVSHDSGRTWEKSTSGIPDETVCTHIVLDKNSPADSRTLYVCGYGSGVFKSTDGGNSWSSADNGLGANRNAWRITLLPSGTLYLIMARGYEDGQIVDGALFRSDDGASNWSPVALPQGVNAPNDLVFDPSNPRRMYLSCWPSERQKNERHGGLLRTEDSGESWERVFDDAAYVYGAAVHPDKPSTVFIATFESAVFRSDDRGTSWRRLEGYNFKWGHRPVPDPHNPGMIYITTFGGSVYHGPDEGVQGAFEGIENWEESWRWRELMAAE
jgi:hypothetical protein